MKIVSDASVNTDQPLLSSPWLKFWFHAEPGIQSLVGIRAGLSLIACWYFASHWVDAGTWFSVDGILATERLGDFLDAGDLADDAKWRVSPLYLLSSTTALRCYLAIGIMLAIAAVMIRTSRAPAILLWLWCLWLANRSLLIAGPEELALVFGLAYLTIPKPNDTRLCFKRGLTPSGKARNTTKNDLPPKGQTPFKTEPSHWTHALARRLLQVHMALLLAATGLTMLASKIWWDGTGSVSIAAPIGRRVFDFTDLLTSPWIHESLTHAIVVVPIAASIMVWLPATRLHAYLAAMIWCVVLALLSSQWMYLATIVVLLQCFNTKREPATLDRN